MDEEVRHRCSSPPVFPVNLKPIGLGLKEEACAWIETEQTTVTWGDTLRGALVLQGRNRAHRITRRVELLLSYTTDEVYYLLARQLLIPNAHTIEPGSMLRCPFHHVISNAAPVGHAISLDIGIRSGCWNQELVLTIPITPPAACLTIAEQFCQVAGMRVGGWEVRRPGTACARLKGIHKRSLFAEAELELSGAASGWRGQFTLRSEPDPAWWRKPGESYLAVPIFAEEPDQIREQLLQMLRGAGIRVGDSHDLPLPAGPGALQANDLPIPDVRKDPSA